jgi:hypothetical protein
MFEKHGSWRAVSEHLPIPIRGNYLRQIERGERKPSNNALIALGIKKRDCPRLADATPNQMKQLLATRVPWGKWQEMKKNGRH